MQITGGLSPEGSYSNVFSQPIKPQGMDEVHGVPPAVERRSKLHHTSITNARLLAETVPGEDRPLTLPVASQIFYNSFYLSQGTATLQEMLLLYVHAKRPSWRVSDEMRAQLIETLLPRTKSLMETGYHQPVEGIPGELEKQAEAMQHILNNESDILQFRSQYFSLSTTAKQIIGSDFHYTFAGRNNRTKLVSSSSSYNPRTDRYLSHICYYGLSSHTTGIPEYDQLFQEINAHLTNTSQDRLKEDLGDSEFEMLVRVVSKYNQEHPDMAVTFPQK